MKPSDENVALALKADIERTVTRTIGISATIVALTLLGTITYCGSRPADPPRPDPQAQLCINKGGSWMPVVLKGERSMMSCVTRDALPMVQQMAKDNS